jgi:tetratricopeptide (TPR) repeat protein
VIAVAAVAAGVLLLRWLATRDESEASLARAGLTSPPLVAVSPFETEGDDTLTASVARSLTQAIVDSLANLGGLRAVATTAADSLLREAELGLGVSGSIERRGTELKATGRVSEGATGVQLFSQAQQAPPDSAQVLEADLAQRLVRFVRRYVGTEVKRRTYAAGTRDAAARGYWSRAMEIIAAIGSPEALSLPTAAADRLAVADSLLGEAIRRDPRWVAPHVARGWAYLESAALHGSEGQRDTDRIAVHRKAVAAADAAIRIAPADPDAHELRGVALVGLWFEAPSHQADSIGKEAELELRRAIALDLNVARAWEALSNYYMYTGRFGEARHAIAQALQADAFLLSEPGILVLQNTAYLNLGHYDEAEQTCARGARWYPQELSFMICRVLVLGWSASDLESAGLARRLGLEAEDQASPAQRSDVHRTHLLFTAAILARGGYTDSAKSILRAFEATRKGAEDLDGFAGDEAYVRLLVGEEAKALALLRTFLRNNWSQRGYIVRTPWFRPLHDHPAFIAMTERRP